jgi:Aspartyl protease
MPCIAGNYNPAVGVILQVAILPQAQLAVLQVSQQQAAKPLPNLTMFAALLDTGASVTCISSNVVQTIGLQPSGKTSMTGSTGQSVVDQYTFLVGFMFGAQQSPSGAISGQLNAHLVQGCEFVSHGFGFDVLIGRDILCKGTLSLSFDGHYVLSF